MLAGLSERAGLAPMVIGLVEGIGEMFDTPVEVELVSPKSGDDDCDEFTIRQH